VNELRKRGLGLAAISYDPPEILAEFSRRHNITFPLLSDTDSSTIKAFGILNTVMEEILGSGKDDPEVLADYLKYGAVTGLGVAKMGKGTPYPGTLMLDPEGRVTSRYFEEFYRERITASTVLMKLGAAAEPVRATKLSAPHLEIKTWPTDVSISPGNVFALALHAVPGEHIHVYAPGAKGYRVLKLELSPQQYVRVLPLRYPQPAIYFFQPLNERVPVYQEPFTLMQEVALEASQEAIKALAGRTELNLSGTLQYQACDDRQCFNPISVPLSWTLKVTPNLGGRIRPPEQK
jgi:hypothetical protein